MTLELRTNDGRVTFAARVQPGARRDGVLGLYGNAVKIALQAPAVDGKANEALVRLLAELLGMPRHSVELVAGHASRSKVIRVTGLPAAEIEARLTPAVPA